jgi:hypothetical protein
MREMGEQLSDQMRNGATGNGGTVGEVDYKLSLQAVQRGNNR